MIDQRILFYLFACAVFCLVLGFFAPELIKQYRKRKAHKLYKQAQEETYSNPEYVRFYKRGTYHVAKAISEEELEEIEKEDPQPEIHFPKNHFIPLFLGIAQAAATLEEQDNFDGCAESAIRLVNQEWANRNDDNNQVAQAW